MRAIEPGAMVTRAALAVTLSICACATPRARPFDNSSVDFNGHRVHRMETVGEYETIIDAIVSLMESGGAVLVKRRETTHGATVLSFRLPGDRPRGATEGRYGAPSRRFRVGTFSGIGETRADYVSYGGLYYVELTPTTDGASIQAIGLPIVDGLTACPPQALSWRECTPVEAPGDTDFAEHVAARGRVDVRGAREAEVLSGLFGHLALKRWQDYFRASLQRGATRQPKPSVVDDVFNAPVMTP